MASRRTRALDPPPSTSPPPVSITDALSKLGMTKEQFQAKQTELYEGLLQNQPFVPHTANTRYVSLREKVKLESLERGRSRSTSISSSSSRAPSPVLPRTPAKHDPTEGVMPRPRDRMELILEEKNRRKHSQRKDSSSLSREDERVFSTPRHPPAHVTTAEWPPETPHHYKYYSERVVGEVSASKCAAASSAVPETPSRGRDHAHFKVPLPRYPVPQTPLRPDAGPSCPVTPRSSPPPVVNLVSSPGPMRSNPPEDEHLPFILPDGPYSTAKPDLSYAAIIGRAILASPGHALALQDIYEYITTVFPYYKRGEPTWMNSVRHALSTMAVFRKVQRGTSRAEGKSLWAIFDYDLPCFNGGGFKKSLCADMVSAAALSKGSRKRGSEDAGGSRSKRRKAAHDQSGSQSTVMPTPIKPPFFPHYTQTTNHQSYYQAACMQQHQIPAEGLFPPLPASSNYHRVVARAVSIPIMDGPLMVSGAVSVDTGTESEPEDDLRSSSPIERPPSTSSLPDLVSSLSTSSSPAPSSHLSLHGDSSRDPSPSVASMPLATMDLPAEHEVDPVAAWFRSGSPSLMATSGSTSNKVKGKTRATSFGSAERRPLSMMAPMQVPSSPTPQRRGIAAGRPQSRSSQRLSPTRAVTSGPNVTDVVRAMERVVAAQPGRPHSLHASLVASAIAAEYDKDDIQERAPTPNRPFTPPPSSTLVGLKQLEAELIDFSPFKSMADDAGEFFGQLASTSVLTQSPSFSAFSSRAPLLRVGSMNDFLANDSLPTFVHSPLAPPHTPKKSPFGASGSFAYPLRMPSPFGTPSRTILDTSADFDEIFAKYIQSPDGLSSNGASQLASPSSFTLQ